MKSKKQGVGVETRQKDTAKDEDLSSSRVGPQGVLNRDDTDNAAAGGSADGCSFNYDDYRRVICDIDLDVFFANNSVPTLKPYPSVFAIKNDYIAMNEKLFKKAKERDEANRQSFPGHQTGRKLRKSYMDIFDPRKKLSRRQHRQVARSVKMYVHSKAVSSLFRNYFALVDYHHQILSMHPSLKRVFYRTIFAIFASMSKKAIMNMLGEISISRKMFVLFTSIYEIWESECSIIEKCMF